MEDYQKQKAEKQARREEYDRRTAELDRLIRPLETAKYECHHDFNYIRRALDNYAEDWGGLDLTPDFQRGHVWTKDQQRHFIENVLRGVVSSSGFVVQFNCTNWDNDSYSGDLPRGFQCIDGLQRITAVLAFMDGEILPFGLHVRDLDGSSYSTKGCRFRLKFAVHTFQTKADLLQHYLDLNAGGTPHTNEEIERVRSMREQILKKEIA